MSIANEHNFAQWKAAGSIHQLAAQCALGQHETAAPLLEVVIEAWRKLGGAELMTPYFLSRLALSKVEQGQAEAALQILDEALTIAEIR